MGRRKTTPRTKQPDATGWPRIAPAIVLAAIAVLVVVAYWPALQGQMLWDDDAHVPKPQLRSLTGLGRIWFDPGATQQYYPLLFSWFWVQHRLFGDQMLGYHLVNVLLHLGAVFLLYLVLQKLKIPGALLATAIFALHPVIVESVAWVTEQKNTLSAVFYFGAVLAYLRFDETRQRGPYVLALLLFIAALLSKTVAVTLPPALLLIFWWSSDPEASEGQRRSLSWQRDVQPLLPFFALALVDGLFTVWFERNIIGAQGPEFDLALSEKFLLAGRAFWFYLEKLVWPKDLILVYPRWDLAAAPTWWWLYPLAVLALFLFLWWIRGQWRAPLAAMLFFLGNLFPVLGFLHVYYFRYSFVADHFQYLACLGPIVLVSAGVALGVERLPAPRRAWGVAACALLVGVLTALSWQQSHLYGRDAIYLYQTMLETNPNSWMIRNNLGDAQLRQGKVPEAIDSIHRALELKPDNEEAEINLGKALARLGQFDESLAHFERSVQKWPDSAKMHNNLGIALGLKNRNEEAIHEFQRAIELEPKNPAGHGNLGAALLNLGRPQEAIAPLEKAITIDPVYQNAQVNLGDALTKTGRASEAIPHLQEATRLNPDHVDAWTNLITAYAQSGHPREAVEAAQRALTLARAQGRTAIAQQLENLLKGQPTSPTVPP